MGNASSEVGIPARIQALTKLIRVLDLTIPVMHGSVMKLHIECGKVPNSKFVWLLHDRIGVARGPMGGYHISDIIWLF